MIRIHCQAFLGSIDLVWMLGLASILLYMISLYKMDVFGVEIDYNLGHEIWLVEKNILHFVLFVEIFIYLRSKKWGLLKYFVWLILTQV